MSGNYVVYLHWEMSEVDLGNCTHLDMPLLYS